MRNSSAKVSNILDFVTPAGNRVHVHYEPRFNGSRLTLKACGTSDIQQAIESHAPFCDLNYMLARLKIGDSSVLTRSQPIYGDFSGLPDNPVDAINLFHSAESSFLKLPLEERKAFGFDFRVWLHQLMSGSIKSEPSHQLDPVAPAEPTPLESEVK